MRAGNGADLAVSMADRGLRGSAVQMLSGGHCAEVRSWVPTHQAHVAGVDALLTSESIKRPPCCATAAYWTGKCTCCTNLMRSTILFCSGASVAVAQDWLTLEERSTSSSGGPFRLHSSASPHLELASSTYWAIAIILQVIWRAGSLRQPGTRGDAWQPECVPCYNRAMMRAEVW
jgi:hypothetical protein